jgi:hypothetical protein
MLLQRILTLLNPLRNRLAAALRVLTQQCLSVFVRDSYTGHFCVKFLRLAGRRVGIAPDSCSAGSLVAVTMPQLG